MAVYTGNPDLDAGIAALNLVKDAMGAMEKQCHFDMYRADSGANIESRAQLMKAQCMIMADLQRRNLRNLRLQQMFPGAS